MTRTLYDLCGRDERLRFSPYCWRVRMALAHKGLVYNTIAWRFEDKQALAFADYDKVPVLCDGDQVITDSFKIMRYLDKAYPDAPVLGEGTAYQRALFFKYYVERSVTPSLFRSVALDLLAAIHPDDRDYFRKTREARFGARLEEVHNPEQGKQQLYQVLAPVREQLHGSPFLDGETPSGIDYLLFGSMMWTHTVSLEPLTEPDDPVSEWFTRMLDAHNGIARQAITIRDLN
ncbi:glutathione S-transferase N-terminal domain-containing protein [Halomonas citrativorans]|uniref:Glutathione S-transferase N-terminal domain-containing protein n=1 Tax=Halomonas citrativorans TaxID=2742612 RepID=A0ABR9FEZ6_9GAMM|nr:glutathione S-transferase N-terminal domain-containing protein [Halomonas citrativorans]MBE0405059.1 glutathione S-transferase N-terminal domain-containing protein [Halomonas citrativorans]